MAITRRIAAPFPCIVDIVKLRHALLNEAWSSGASTAPGKIERTPTPHEANARPDRVGPCVISLDSEAAPARDKAILFGIPSKYSTIWARSLKPAGRSSRSRRT